MAILRSFVFLTVITVLLSACSEGTNPNEEAIRFLNESLEFSQKAINHSTQNSLHKLEEMLQDPTTSTKSQIWFPRAKMVEELTYAIVADIDFLKNRLNDVPDKSKALNDVENINGEIGKLREKLVAYNSSLQAIDSQMTHEFPNPVKLAKERFSDANSLPIYLFSRKINVNVAVSLLNQFETVIKIVENRMIQYAVNHLAYTHPYFDSYGAFIAINAMRAEPGTKLEITAGVGAFSKSANPQITVDGKLCSVSSDGASHYIFNAPKAPGKYKKHVQIEYLNNDTGKMEMAEKDVNYSVAP